MWEWSNRLLRKKDSEESKSLLAAYNDLLLQNAYAPQPLKKTFRHKKIPLRKQRRFPKGCSNC